jgi:hypothetical protein
MDNWIASIVANGKLYRMYWKIGKKIPPKEAISRVSWGISLVPEAIIVQM